MPTSTKKAAYGVFDVAEACRDALDPDEAEERMGLLAAYFWCNINLLTPERMSEVWGGGDVFPRPAWTPGEARWVRAAHATPQTYVFFQPKDGWAVVTIRGTNVAADLAADLTPRSSPGKLGRGVRREVDGFVDGGGGGAAGATTRGEVARACTHLFEGVVTDVRDRGMHVHAGLFAFSVRCMLGVTYELVSAGKLSLLPRRTPAPLKTTRASKAKRQDAGPPTAAFASADARVQIYGHSMGGACAAFVYAWLRDMVGPAEAPRVSCVCLSTPRIVDEAARAAWFNRHDVEATMRHYFTRGDVVVHALPSFAGLTHHPTRFHRRCPMAPLRGYARVARSVYAHVVYQPLRLRRIVVREGARWSSRVDEGRAPLAAPGRCRGALPSDPREPFVLADARFQPAVDLAALAKDARAGSDDEGVLQQQHSSYVDLSTTRSQRRTRGDATMEEVVFDTPEGYAAAMRAGELPA